MSQLNAALERKNASERKINSKKRYNRASEDPISAAKALRTRKAISNTNDYLANLETAEQIYNGADSVLMNVNDILDNIIDKVTYAANGTQHDEDEEILAQTVETFADEIVRLFNTDIAERRIFGGVNNDTTVFKIENAGGKKTITYNGVDINSIDDPDKFPYSESSFTDIGTGMVIDPATGRVDPQSALPVTFNGAKITGCGKDDEGDSKNIIQITLDAAQQMRAGATIETAIDFLPKGGADVSFDKGTLSINYTPTDINIDWENINSSVVEFVPGNIEFIVKEHPRVEIEYVGEPIYVPPSANPAYVAPKKLNTKG